jgi:HPt (histidine-containing phosphotransfer) domain-containing protein
MNPIHFEELLDRVSGNREFVIQMLDMFFQSSGDRLTALRREFLSRNYDELADLVHKLKGIAGNLSINRAVSLLKNLYKAIEVRNDPEIESLLSELEESIAEAKVFYQNNPSLNR